MGHQAGDPKGQVAPGCGPRVGGRLPALNPPGPLSLMHGRGRGDEIITLTGPLKERAELISETVLEIALA